MYHRSRMQTNRVEKRKGCKGGKMRSPVCGLSDNANRLSRICIVSIVSTARAKGLLVIIRQQREVREGSEREGTEFIRLLTPIIIILYFSSSNVQRAILQGITSNFHQRHIRESPASHLRGRVSLNRRQNR